ncbi:MAG: flagellar hook-length control protein FliK [Fimbriimonadales bacterium]|nr:flagellar hook-length control protein FliK [Fimbriimonadales bacterium]
MPMIALEPTPETAMNLPVDTAGMESSDAGVFEQVLHELLDSDTELSEVGVFVSPPSLTPLPTEWAMGNETSLARTVGEGLESETSLARTVGNGLDSEMPLAHAAGEWSEVKVGAPISQVAFEGLGTESETLLAPAVGEGLGVGNETPSSSGDEGIYPVLPARQGETPSSPLLLTEGAGEFYPPDQAAKPASLEPSEKPAERASYTSVPHGATMLHGVSHAMQAPAVDSPHHAEPNWNAVNQVAQHIERMVYDRERDAITVRLDPPELGVIELRIQTTGSEVQAWVNAERDLTRQLLQQAQQQLREQLESRGLQLTHFDVGGQSHSRFAQARPSRTPAIQSFTTTHPSTATDSLSYDGRWSVWV